MDKVLLVEDDEAFLEFLQGALKKQEDRFLTLTAKDGREAMEILKKDAVSLVVTDLHMPRMDGLALLSYISEHHPALPCIVMTAHATTQMKDKLPEDLLRFLYKPFEVGELMEAVAEGLSQERSDGSLNGISAANFAQLIEMEQKTCLFEVQAEDGGKGYFYFKEGAPYNAVYGDLKGEEAAMVILTLERPRIRLVNLPKKNIGRRIVNSLMNLIMAAMKDKDESRAGTDEGSEEGGQDVSPGAMDPLGDEDLAPMAGKETGAALAKPVEEAGSSKEMTVHQNLKEDHQMALESYMEELKEIKGFKAAAIMNFTGEVLASASLDSKVDLDTVGATFNDIFRSAHEASRKVGLSACNEMGIKTPQGIIIMACSGVESKVHFHMIAVLGADGNQALMKMRIDKLVPAIMKDLG